MFQYIIKRILQAVPIFIGITLLVYFVFSLAPGSPLDIIASSGNLSQGDLDALRHTMGLDKPVYVRYLLWLGDLFRGDLGNSLSTGEQVAVMIGQRVAPTLLLTLTALCLALIISLPLGIVSAWKPYSHWDNGSSVLAFLGASTPNFFLSLIVIYLFAVKLKLLPTQGMYSAGAHKSLSDLMAHIIMPAFVLAMQLIGTFIKQTRGSVLEVLKEDYVRTARSKGISELRVITHHVLRNSWIPIVTSIVLMVPLLIGGAVVTEQIFSWPGIGSLMIQSINARDYNLIMGITVLISTVVLLSNILADVMYSILDPRIGLE